MARQRQAGLERSADGYGDPLKIYWTFASVEHGDFKSLGPVATTLRERVRKDEALYGRSDKDTDSLWDHLERVSSLAERLGQSEGIDPFLCRLAGWFHDAGKFAGGRYHDDERPEEEIPSSVFANWAVSMH